MFITPNMCKSGNASRQLVLTFIVNDAHDTGIVYGADWLYPFLEPLLVNENFMNNTLLVISEFSVPPLTKVYMLKGDRLRRR